MNQNVTSAVYNGITTKVVNDEMKEVIAMEDMTNKLPESLTLRIEYTITREEYEEYLQVEADDQSLGDMIQNLRDHAHEMVDFNAIELASIFDENGVDITAADEDEEEED
jgi:hypothetical protein